MTERMTLTALMDAAFPTEVTEPPYLTNCDPGDEA